jgi:hypothetical protein
MPRVIIFIRSTVSNQRRSIMCLEFSRNLWIIDKAAFLMLMVLYIAMRDIDYLNHH